MKRVAKRGSEDVLWRSIDATDSAIVWLLTYENSMIHGVEGVKKLSYGERYERKQEEKKEKDFL